jgi:hypothetical protein
MSGVAYCQIQLDIPANFSGFPLKIGKATAKIVSPGDYIDILIATDIKQKNNAAKEKIVATFLQDVKILSSFKINGENYLILQLSLIEDSYLALAAKKPIKISLRAKGTHVLYPIEVARVSDFAGAGNLKIAGGISERSIVRSYLLKISDKQAKLIKDAESVNIKLNGKIFANDIIVINHFTLDGNNFVSLELTNYNAQYLFMAETGNVKIVLEKNEKHTEEEVENSVASEALMLLTTIGNSMERTRLVSGKYSCNPADWDIALPSDKFTMKKDSAHDFYYTLTCADNSAAVTAHRNIPNAYSFTKKLPSGEVVCANGSGKYADICSSKLGFR